MAEKRPRPKWTLAVAALLQGATVAETAAAAGVSERSVYAWLALPEFNDLLQAERRRVMDAAAGKLQLLTDKAVSTLDRLLDCGEKPTEARAALGILAWATKTQEQADLLARLEKLERRQELDKRRFRV